MEWQGRESPTSCAAAEVPCEVEAAAVQGCDPAVMHRSKEQLDKWVAELPFPFWQQHSKDGAKEVPHLQ